MKVPILRHRIGSRDHITSLKSILSRHMFVCRPLILQLVADLIGSLLETVVSFQEGVGLCPDYVS